MVKNLYTTKKKILKSLYARLLLISNFEDDLYYYYSDLAYEIRMSISHQLIIDILMDTAEKQLDRYEFTLEVMRYFGFPIKYRVKGDIPVKKIDCLTALEDMLNYEIKRYKIYKGLKKLAAALNEPRLFHIADIQVKRISKYIDHHRIFKGKTYLCRTGQYSMDKFIKDIIDYHSITVDYSR